MSGRSFKEHIIATIRAPHTTLDFETFNGYISTVGQEIHNNDFTDLLASYPNVTTVNFSKHPEISGLLCSLMRKNLPNLQTLILKNILADKLQIPVDQLAKLYASGVKIEADPNLMQNIKSQLIELLRTADKNEYADALQASDDISQGIQPDELIDACRIVSEKREQKARQEMEVYHREISQYDDHKTLYVFTKKLMIKQHPSMKITVYADSEQTAKQYLETALSFYIDQLGAQNITPEQQRSIEIATAEGFTCRALEGGEVFNEYHGRRGGVDDVYLISETNQFEWKKRDLDEPGHNVQAAAAPASPPGGPSLQ